MAVAAASAGQRPQSLVRRPHANASKRIKRIAIIALARKLIVAMWRYLTTGLVPDQAVLKA
ncbi:MAG: transposase [Bradyrhizobium sp.]|nr:transposase [Bradyrhizobium sp.]